MVVGDQLYDVHTAQNKKFERDQCCVAVWCRLIVVSGEKSDIYRNMLSI